MIASTNGSAPALLFLFFRKVNCCLFSPFPVVPGLMLVKNLKTLKSGIHGKTFAIDWIHIQAVLICPLVEQNKIFRQLHHQHDSINPVQPVHQIHSIDVNLLIKSIFFSSFKPKFTQFVQYTLLIHSTPPQFVQFLTIHAEQILGSGKTVSRGETFKIHTILIGVQVWVWTKSGKRRLWIHGVEWINVN